MELLASGAVRVIEGGSSTLWTHARTSDGQRPRRGRLQQLPTRCPYLPILRAILGRLPRLVT
jgi:hypothetical protein